MTTISRRQVPETAAGFGYQFERALLWLVRCQDLDAVVGIETDDDVAVKDPQGKNVLEQDKLSYATTGHPFQDRGIALWKTLDGWLIAARQGTPHQRVAELHLVTNRPVPDDCLARRLSDPKKDVDQCIRDLRDIAASPSETIEKHALNIKNAADEELAKLIARIRLSDARDGTGSTAMLEQIAAALVLPLDVDKTAVIDALNGWLLRTAQELWRRHEPAWISRRTFVAQYHAVLDGLKRKRKRERAERQVPVSSSEREGARVKGFVERLIEIDLPDDEIDVAIDSYIRHSTESWRLAREGEYTADDWLDFYGQLRARWDLIRLRNRRIAQQNAWPPEKQGYHILEETTYREFCGPLGGEPTTYPYFTQGGYHRLADEDRVWWSPNYVPLTGDANEED